MSDVLRLLKAETRDLVRQVVANAIQFSRFTLSSSSGEHDQVAGHHTEGPDEESYDYEVRRLQHFGFRSRPPKDVWALRVAASGGATNGATVAEDSTRYGPSDLEDGEVALYNRVSGLEIRFDKNGNITIRSADGKLVSLQGGQRGIARLDDTVAASKAMAAWMGQVDKALNALSSGAIQPTSDTFASQAIGQVSSASEKSKTG
jgi:phage gp45-like